MPASSASRRPARISQRDDAFRRAGTGGVLTAVRGVNFSVRDGEVVSLIGPSGCGKSTLLNIGSGLAAPSEGTAFVDGARGRRAERASRLHAAEGPAAAVAHRRRERHVRRRDPAACRCRSAGAEREQLLAATSTSPNSPGTIRTNCRAACGSVWRWRARSRSIRMCCCSTNRSRQSTRRRGSCCSAIWRKRWPRMARPRC